MAIKSRRVTWEEHVALIQDMRNIHRILGTEPGGKNDRRRWEDNIKMGLKVNWSKVRITFTSSGQGPAVRYDEHGKESPGSTKHGEFPHVLRDHQPLKDTGVSYDISETNSHQCDIFKQFVWLRLINTGISSAAIGTTGPMRLQKPITVDWFTLNKASFKLNTVIILSN